MFLRTVEPLTSNAKSDEISLLIATDLLPEPSFTFPFKDASFAVDMDEPANTSVVDVPPILIVFADALLPILIGPFTFDPVAILSCVVDADVPLFPILIVPPVIPVPILIVPPAIPLPILSVPEPVVFGFKFKVLVFD